MADYQTRDAKIWLSKEPQAAMGPTGVDSLVGADFEAVSSVNVLPGVLPNIEKTDDAGRVGTGTEFATHTCNQYWEAPTLNLSNDQDLFGIYGRLWLRAHGDPVVDVAAAPGFKHSAPMRDGNVNGRQLPASAMIYDLGPEDFLLGDLVVAQAVLAKSGVNPPTLSFDLLGTGYHQSPHPQTGLPAYVPPVTCADIGAITVKYTKADASVVDLSASGCRFKDLVATVNNNLRANDRCIGDPSLTVNGGTARYTRRLLYVAPRQIGAQFTFLVDDALQEYKLMTKNEEVTSVIIEVHGGVIGVGPAVYTIGVTYPKAVFRQVQAVDSDGDSGYSAILQPLQVSGQPIATAYVINAEATDYK